MKFINVIEKNLIFGKAFGRETYARLENKLYDPIPDYGCVYLIQLGDTDIFKIGMTVNIEQRLKQLQSKCPIPLHVIHQWHGHDYRAFENMLHLQFAKKRITGEWFKLKPEDLIWLADVFPEQYDLYIQGNKN